MIYKIEKIKDEKWYLYLISQINDSYDIKENASVKVDAKKFSSEDPGDIDLISIDIEGSELNLLTDLKKLFFKSIQIELINYNSIESNINFVKELHPIYNFYNPVNWEQLNFEDLQNLIVETLKTNSKIDIFLINKDLSL